MSERLNVLNLTQLVDGPPVKKYRDGGQDWIEEDCSCVGWIDADRDQHRYLSDLGVDLSYAYFDPDTMRWERCLFSEEVADLLEDLHSTGDFPYAFEAGPSQGELEWLEAQACGATELPELPLKTYLIPANAERLAILAESCGKTSPT